MIGFESIIWKTLDDEQKRFLQEYNAWFKYEKNKLSIQVPMASHSRVNQGGYVIIF